MKILELLSVSNQIKSNQSEFNFDHEDVNSFSNTIFAVNFAIIIIGIFGNALSIYAYLQKLLRQLKFNWYLLVLAICELMFCLILAIDYFFCFFHRTRIFLHDLNLLANMTIDYLIHLIDSYVTILTLILSVDRLYAIKNLNELKSFFTNKHAKLLMMISLVSLTILKFPSLIICYMNVVKSFNIVFCSIISPTLFNMIPTIVILIVNSLLVCEILRYNKKIERERLSIITRKRSVDIDLKICRKNSHENIELQTHELPQQPQQSPEENQHRLESTPPRIRVWSFNSN